MPELQIKFRSLDGTTPVDWAALGEWQQAGVLMVAKPKPRWWERLFPWMKRKPAQVHTWTVTATPSSQEGDTNA